AATLWTTARALHDALPLLPASPRSSRRLHRHRKKLSASPDAARQFVPADDRGRDVRVRYSSSLSSARLSSTMLTTGWPIYFTSGCWLYFAISCVSCSTLRLRAFATRGICQTAACGVILLSSPLADAVT